MSVGGLLDIDERDLDAATVLGSCLQGRHVHIVRDTQAEVAVIESHIRDDSVGDVAEPAPGARIEIDGVLLILAGADGPGAAEDDLMGACLPVVKTAEIDGAGASRDREISAAVGGHTDGYIDGVYPQEGLFRPVEMVGRYPKIIVIVTVGRPVVQGPQVHIEIIDADILVIDRFGRAAEPGAVQLEAILEGELVAVQGPVGISTLETNAELVQSVLIQGLVVSGGKGNKVAGEDAAGRLVRHGHQSHPPGVIFREAIAHDGGIDGYGGCNEGIVNGRPLIAVVPGYTYDPVEFTRKGRIQRERRGKELRESRVLSL